MGKKSNSRLILFGGVLIAVLVSVLILNSDEIENFTTLAGRELSFEIPHPDSLIPSTQTTGFTPIVTTQAVNPNIECKIKHTVTIFDQFGKQVGQPIQSSGLVGSPTLSLISESGIPVGYYTIEPKIFCQLSSGYPNVLIKESDLQLRIQGTRPNALTDTNIDTLVIQNMKSNPVVYSSQSGLLSGQSGEKSLGKFTIPATTINEKLIRFGTDFTSQLTFRVTGTINVGFQDSKYASFNYEYPIGTTDLVAYYNQKVVESIEDNDKDGITNAVDKCLTEKETYNGYLDNDGCPDVKPTTDTTPTGTDTTIVDNPVNQQSCNSEMKTWTLDSAGNGFCYSKIVFGSTFCKVYDIPTKQCIDPKIGDTTTTTTPTSTPTTTPTTTPTETQLTDAEIVTDLLKGRIVTIVTYNYKDNTMTDVSSDNLVNTASALTTGSILGTPTEEGEKKELNSLTFTAYYTRSELSEVNSIQLKESGITMLPVMRVAGQTITFDKLQITGKEIGATGKTFGGNYHGIPLGKGILTVDKIQEKAFEFVTAGSQRDASLSLLTEGIVLLEKQSVPKPITIRGASITLDALTISNAKTVVAQPNCEKLGLIATTDSNGNITCSETGAFEEICTSTERAGGFPCSSEYVDTYCARTTPITCNEPDNDGDNVPNYRDDCPSEKEDNIGEDGVGFPDGCPFVSSGTQCQNTNTCTPVPKDSDGDGLIDTVDQCPTVAGSPDNKGCPAPKEGDADGDGIPDVSDNCPTVAGSGLNRGCPVNQGGGGNNGGYTGGNAGGFLCSVNAQGQQICSGGTIFDDPMLLTILAVGILGTGIIILVIRRRK